MTCKDCVYYPACTYHMWCDLFKNKADVVEIRHGKWGDTGIDDLDLIYSGYKCSECGEIICGNAFPYCPYCGTKMDGKDDIE